MKKLLALLLAMMMVMSLAACGGSDDTVDSDPVDDEEISEPVDETGEDAEDAATGLTDNNGNEVTQETIAALTEAYNAIAIPYNEIIMAVNENGWMADEQTAAEVDAVSNTLGFIGTALTEDLSMLDGTDFEALINSLETEFPEVLDILSERVTVPYEG